MPMRPGQQGTRHTLGRSSREAGARAICGSGARTMLTAQPEFWVRVLPVKVRPVMLVKLKGCELCVQGYTYRYV